MPLVDQPQILQCWFVHTALYDSRLPIPSKVVDWLAEPAKPGLQLRLEFL
jgi:hypothetical protein